MTTGYIRDRIRYSDFKVNLTPHPVKKDVVVNTNEDSVKRSIMNLMLTSPYERFFNPSIGAGLRDYLFENYGSLTNDAIKDKIREVISAYEPRAELLDTTVETTPNQHDLEITIVFATINTPEPLTLSLILERIR